MYLRHIRILARRARSTFARATRKIMAATLKRTDSKVLKEKPVPARSCVVCTATEDDAEEDIALIRPCRDCDEDYCVGCLAEMFTGAVRDPTRMPPRCCNMLQKHTIDEMLDKDENEQYREKFEEWLTASKTYCPSPSCSAFISERLIPASPASKDTKTPPVTSLLQEIFNATCQSPAARFFRGEMDITQLPGYTNVVANPIHLGNIQANMARYSVKSLTADMQLLVNNATSYNGKEHPVSKAAEQLFAGYLHALCASTERLLGASNAPTGTPFFACPKCHIAICTSCKQIEHGKKPCDTTALDHETAMLATFGYKRCPRCKAGVKKMYGCSHIQCLCGMHWCYYCEKAIDQCDGACEERAEEDEEDDYYSEGEELTEEEAMVEAQLQQLQAQDNTGDVHPPMLAPNVPPVEPTGTDAHHNALATLVPGDPAPTPTPAEHRPPVNHDRGGYARWAEMGYEFGEEPEEDPTVQVWSCRHRYQRFKATRDGYDRGNFEAMECNRCFERVVPYKAIRKSMFTFSSGLKGIEDKGGMAWECQRCRFIACEVCKLELERKQQDADEQE